MARAPRPVAVPEGGFRRIAVIRLSSLGDVVLTLPVVDALARAYPSARLSYWVREEYAEVVRHHPGIGHVRTLARDEMKIEDLVSMSAELEDYDLIVDLHGNARARVLAFRQKAPVLRGASYRMRRVRWVRARWSRPPAVPPAIERHAAALLPLGLGVTGAPRIHVAPEAEAWGAETLAQWGAAWGGAGPLALCPGARHFTKRWPEPHWVALDQALEAAGIPRLWFSLAAERDALPALAARVASAAGARWCVEPLGRMAALLSGCRAAVTGDTGLMHVAAARGLRVVALFGSTSPVLGFSPAGEGHVVLCRNEPCQPCTLHGLEACPKGHFRCMREMLPAEVLAAIARALPAA